MSAVARVIQLQPRPSPQPPFFCRPGHHEPEPRTREYCIECGFVFDVPPVSVAPSLYARNSLDTTQPMGFRGLTLIKDATGKRLKLSTRRQFREISRVALHDRDWKGKRERREELLRQLLARAHESLGFGWGIEEQTLRLVRKASGDGLLSDVPLEKRLAVCLFAVMRSRYWLDTIGAVRWKDVADALEIDGFDNALITRVRQQYQIPTPVPQLRDFLRWHEPKLGLHHREKQIVLSWIEEPSIQDMGGMSPSPTSVVAALIYLAGRQYSGSQGIENGVHYRSQDWLGKQMKITPVTLRSIVKEVEKRLEAEGKL